MKRSASAVWNGGLKSGNGTLSAASGVLQNVPYSFAMRFADASGTNPEELIAAAHAGCFSMAFSGQLEKAGLKPERISTTAVVSLEVGPAGASIPAVHLSVSAKVPGASREAFETAANNAKTGCPVSKLLNASITMDAHLEA